jgi:hypothetical protein
MTGPLETEADARNLPAVRAVHETPGHGDTWKAERHRRNAAIIPAALAAAGVQAGAFDRQVIAWLANWEPEKPGVIAALIERAYESGRAAAARDEVLELLHLARCELSPEAVAAMDIEALEKHLREAHPEDGPDTGGCVGADGSDVGK